MVINIVSLNVRGLNDKIKRRSIFNKHRNRCHILCLQETHSTKETCELWTNEWGGQAFYSHGERNARGVAIYVNRSFNGTVKEYKIDPNGRTCIVDVTFNDQTFRIVCIYAPNRDSPGYFINIFRELSQSDFDKVVIIGDFNTVLDVKMD